MSSLSSPAASSATSPEIVTTDQGGRKYKGVRRRKWGKWVSEIRLPNSRERIWLGSYDAPEKAARAFDAAFVCLRGPQAAAGADLNFPDSPPPPCRHSVDPEEVQAAALSHANRASITAREAAASLIDDCSPAPAALSMNQWSFTQHDQQGMDAFGGDEMVALDGSVDWRTVMAQQQPIFSPTAGWGSNAYDFLQLPPPLPSGDEDMEEGGHGASASLWSFDPKDSYFRY